MMSKSTIIRDIQTKFTKDKKLLNMSNIDNYKYSITKLRKHNAENTDEHIAKVEKLSHFFHFQRWNHSLKVKFFAEAILIIIISVSMFICSRDALEKSTNIDSFMANYNSYSTQLQATGLTSTQIASFKLQQQQVWSSILSEAKLYVDLITEACIYCILITPFLLKDIQQIIYANLRKKDSTFSSGILLVSCISVALAGELTYSLFFDYKKVVPESDPDYYYKVYKASQYEASYWSLQHTFGTLLSFQFTRVFFFLAATRVFGPMLHIIISMLFEVIRISIIEGSIIIIFFCFGRLCFYSIPAFNSDVHAFSTLLEVSLGNFDMTIFDNPSIKFSKYYGYVFMYVFICISTITLLNFVIAIITHVYDYKSKIGVGLYLKTVILMRQVLDSDEKYSSIAFMVPPLNFITFIFTPFVMYFGSKRLNNALLHVCFFPIMLSGTTIFMTISLLLCPIDYLITFEKLIKRLFSTGRKDTPKIVKLADVVIFIFCGLFILIGQVMLDTISFISDLYEEDLLIKFRLKSKKSDAIVNSELDPRFYSLFVSFLQQQTKSYLPSKEIIKELSQVLKIDKQIYNLLFTIDPNATQISRNTLKTKKNKKRMFREATKDFEELTKNVLGSSSCKHVLEQFNTLKRIINNNSIPNDLITVSPELNSQKEESNFKKIKQFKKSTFSKEFKISEAKKPRGYIQNIFYIREFLELIEEIQIKSVFKQMIDINKFGNLGIKKFTKLGSGSSFDDPALIRSKNLMLLKQVRDKEIPSEETLELINASRNYKVMKELHSNDQSTRPNSDI